MKEENFINCHVHAYGYFGGVTRLVVPDNLRAGVTKNTRFETVIPRAYLEMAEYYDTAIVPASVKSPDDKPNAEGSVKFATTWILAALRSFHFFSLAEAKEAAAQKLEELNNRPFQKRVCSRRSAYETEEKEFMLPLPEGPFEPAVWATAKVPNDYCVSDRINRYSVPFDLIGERVDIRITKNMVEVLFHGSRVAYHMRLPKAQRDPVVIPEHMPEAHRKYLSYTKDSFLSWAEPIGPYTLQTVRHFLMADKEPEQGYKYCASLMRATDRYGRTRIESACERVLSFSSVPTLRNIQTVLKNGQDKVPLNSGPQIPVSQAKRCHGITRSADAFRKGGINI
ncbi:Mu transposase domain-containing protein [Blautia hominis]|uniref:Mu transposase domain-containing protein n=1 Tax=Blautia hominis TaxID=2025493 RepID=UPI0036F3DC5D